MPGIIGSSSGLRFQFEWQLLRQLSEQFEVSHQVAANQVLNSIPRLQLDDEVRQFLEHYRAVEMRFE